MSCRLDESKRRSRAHDFRRMGRQDKGVGGSLYTRRQGGQAVLASVSLKRDTGQNAPLKTPFSGHLAIRDEPRNVSVPEENQQGWD
jgi:hypothetical protein